MREGDWIAMPGVPLITAGNTEVAKGAAADVENDGAGEQCDDARTTEEVTRPGAKNVRNDGAEGPSGGTKCAEATVNTVVPALPSVGTSVAPEGDVVPTPDENVPTASNAEENPVGDTSEMAHAAELEATLLAARSRGGEPPPPPRSPQPPSRLSLWSSLPKPRSKGCWAVIL
jgi:hypothetical protein